MTIAGPVAFENATRAANARWDRARFDADRLTVEHVPKFRLDLSNRVFCIGSCFARNIEEAMIYRGVDVLSKRLPCPAEEWSSRHTGIVNKFTTASMANELEWALAGNGSGVPFLHHSEQGSFDLQLVPQAPAVKPERAIERRTYIETDYFARIRQADVMILTLGLIETWFDHKHEVWQNAAPSYYLVRREPERFRMAVTSVADNRVALERIRALACAAKPNIKFVVTVSPVPMDTTFTGLDIFTANLHSKSTLRAAAVEFANDHDDVDYFPSYEVVIGSNRAAAYKDDCLHVRQDLVREIIGRFTSLYLGEMSDAPPEFVETLYLKANPDVDAAVRRGELTSGFEHWQKRGHTENRPLSPPAA